MQLVLCLARGYEDGVLEFELDLQVIFREFHDQPVKSKIFVVLELAWEDTEVDNTVLLIKSVDERLAVIVRETGRIL